MGDISADALDREDSRLWLLDYQRGLVQLLTDWKDLSVDLGLFGAGTLTVTLHKDSITATNGGEGVLATDFGWNGTKGQMSLDLYHRGTRVFSGPIQTVVKSHEGYAGTAYVTVTAETWLPALLRRRHVRTATGAPFVVTDDSWRDIARTLVAQQTTTALVVTPTGWQVNSEVRTDFGPFTVVAVGVSDTGTADYSVEVRTNLWDAVCELCNMPASEDDKLWPTITESPAGTFTVDFLVGRTGAGRAIGADKSTTVFFSTLHNTVDTFEKQRDGAATENHLVSGGKGPGAGQSVRHAANDTSITTKNLGVFEGVEDVLGGRANYEMDNELTRALYERADVTSWTAKVTESAGQYWPASFGICDTVTVYDGHFAETVASMIVGIKLTYPAPGPYTLELVFGKGRNELRAIGRAGGGGGGGRGGGGRSRNHDGTRYVYDHIDCDSGNITAHEAQTGLDLVGVSCTDVRIQTTGTEETADGTDDKAELDVVGTFSDTDTPVCNGFVTLRDGGGRTIKLLARYVAP